MIFRWETAVEKYEALMKSPFPSSSSSDVIQLPSYATALKEAAFCLLHAKKYSQCIALCDKIIKNQPVNGSSSSSSQEPSQENTITSEQSGDGNDQSETLSGKRAHSETEEKVDVVLQNETVIAAYTYKSDALTQVALAQKADIQGALTFIDK